jgi:hypothetical protein
MNKGYNMAAKNNKRDKLRKSMKKRRGKKKKVEQMIMIEEDCKDAPDPERRKEYLISVFKRLEEYYENIQRDPGDPKWESSSHEGF